jgi:hypothetical protein
MILNRRGVGAYLELDVVEVAREILRQADEEKDDEA